MFSYMYKFCIVLFIGNPLFEVCNTNWTYINEKLKTLMETIGEKLKLREKLVELGTGSSRFLKTVKMFTAMTLQT